MNTRRISLLLFLAIVSLATFVGIKQYTKGITVFIVNNGSQSITDVKLNFTGGYVNIPILKSGHSETTRIIPTSESHLEVEFSDAIGKKHLKKVGVYLEPAYKGKITITVHGNLEISWQDSISVY